MIKLEEIVNNYALAKFNGFKSLEMGYANRLNRTIFINIDIGGRKINWVNMYLQLIRKDVNFHKYVLINKDSNVSAYVRNDLPVNINDYQYVVIISDKNRYDNDITFEEGLDAILNCFKDLDHLNMVFIKSYNSSYTEYDLCKAINDYIDIELIRDSYTTRKKLQEPSMDYFKYLLSNEHCKAESEIKLNLDKLFNISKKYNLNILIQEFFFYLVFVNGRKNNRVNFIAADGSNIYDIHGVDDCLVSALSIIYSNKLKFIYSFLKNNIEKFNPVDREYVDDMLKDYQIIYGTCSDAPNLDELKSVIHERGLSKFSMLVSRAINFAEYVNNN